MIFPLIVAAVAISAVGSIIKDVGASSAKEDQLKANDNALRIAEEHNAEQAQQARLAVMGGAFSSGSFDGYISQQLYFANADLVAKRQNIAAERSAIRANEIGTAVGIVGKAVMSYAMGSASMKMLKKAGASASALTDTGHRAISDSLESNMRAAGKGMTSYMNRSNSFALDDIENFGAELVKGLGVIPVLAEDL